MRRNGGGGIGGQRGGLSTAHVLARRWLAALACASVIPLTSCATQVRNRELSRVAKDWCMTIRASQVVPVYPLTEDLEVGDLFIVQTPIEQEVEVYKSAGFLPMDNPIGRLAPTGFHRRYQPGYGVITGSVIPRLWQFPDGDQSDGVKTEWRLAPRAAFPTYSFNVQQSQGLNLAIPVQGVPIGLALLGAQNARGDITISDAYTYGLDRCALEPQILIWAAENKERLAQFGPTERVVNDRFGQKRFEQVHHYLRVVARVYLTGAVNISLHNQDSFGGAASAGAPQPVNLLNLQNVDAASRYTELLNAINRHAPQPATQPAASPAGSPGGGGLAAAAGAPAIGGSVKVASFSARSISLNETFPRPLVIGYLGFDYRIGKSGDLETAVSTQDQLLQRVSSDAQVIRASVPEPTAREMAAPLVGRIRAWLGGRDSPQRAELREWLAEQNVRGSEALWINSASAADLQRAVEQLNIP